MKAQEYRSKTDEELAKEILALSREAFNLRMQQGTGQLARPTQIRSVRKDLARIKTILNERRGANS